MKQSTNDPSEATPTPRPEEFPLGSLESRAAARMLAENRRAALIPVQCHVIRFVDPSGLIVESLPPICQELDPKRITGSDKVRWMTRQELEAKRREYEEYKATQHADASPIQSNTRGSGTGIVPER